MLNDTDRAMMRAAAAAIRSDWEAEIILWREEDGDDVQLAPQPVRLALLTNDPKRRVTPEAESITAPLLVKGKPSGDPNPLDIQQGDRFTYQGVAYVIDLVRARRDIETVAEARVQA